MGHNSSRYLILDIAIGLSGAVSVPIYYTSPLNEIKEILGDSGAKILFAGTSEVLKGIIKCNTEIPVILFCGDGPGNDLNVFFLERIP